MNYAPRKIIRAAASNRKTTILLMSVVFFFAAFATDAHAQRRFSKTYPVGKNVHLQLTNRVGMVQVQGWDKDRVEIVADLEAPTANIVPQSLSGKIVINVIADNPERADIGSCNFYIRVPFDSKVDIETRMGNLIVKDVRGPGVRAYVSSDGDITLTNIYSSLVRAENKMGDILYDGQIQPGGTYHFSSMSGAINLRIPFSSSFRLVATAPSTRSISLGSFSNADLSFVSNGRRVVGQINGGSASLTVTNQRGSISFIPR